MLGIEIKLDVGMYIVFVISLMATWYWFMFSDIDLSIPGLIGWLFGSFLGSQSRLSDSGWVLLS